MGIENHQTTTPIFFFFFVKRYLYLRTHTFLSDGGSGTEEQGGVTEKRARLWR